ncbi:hypothetical protein OC846_000725 [Tilletia horrida]|uniref:Uncharacterized protein n=1 Tax=Tilletia horrida TaxID=155126 RepID=A0AAN6GVE7_9BASI|nr:hypothetical protein OC846_000725 [Tilletia horrida]KAK0568088.1 hypothetical protein OC861_002332 [Tilletia horrida]
MSNPNSAPPMASKPSQGAHSTRSTPMTRVGTTRSVANDERTEASDALVQVLSATLIRGTNATPSRAGGTLLPMPGTVEPSHSLAHTAGAPVAILNASGDNNINASETAAPLGLGHALPNTDMSRLASAQSAASHSHSVAIADAPPLIVHHLRQLINEQINRNDAAVQVLPSVGMEEAEEEPLSAAEMERMRSSLSRRPQTLVTTYLSARASMDNGSVETVAPNGPAGGHHIMMDKEVDPSCSARSAHMGPMSTVQLPVLDSKAEVRTFRNPWARARHWMREPLAEALGTFILMVFGNGINAQVNLSRLIDPSSPKGDFLSGKPLNALMSMNRRF